MGATQSMAVRNSMVRRIEARRRMEAIQEHRTAAEEERDSRDAETFAELSRLSREQHEATRTLVELERQLAQGDNSPTLLDEIRLAAQAHTDVQSRLEHALVQTTKRDWAENHAQCEREEEKRLGKKKYVIHNQQSPDYLFSQPTGPLSKCDCVICLEAITTTPGDPRQLPCGHVLHHECLRDWFALESRCPLCRKEFRMIRPNGPPESYFRDMERRWRQQVVDAYARMDAEEAAISTLF